jgi:hypothetical protein
MKGFLDGSYESVGDCFWSWYSEASIQVLDHWLHRLERIESFSLIQRWMVGDLYRITWDLGGGGLSLHLRLLGDKQFQEGRTVMSPFC